jgi:5-methylcytosine-specific restriction enzyme A
MTVSTRRISRKAGWASPKRLPQGENGRALCRRCGQEVPKGRLTFCSQECVHQWKITTNPGYVRDCVLERDHGVCQECGLDCVKTKDGISYLDMEYHEKDKLLQSWGIKDWSRSLWEAHHIVAVSQGGGECGLDNYQTLCWRCHRLKTRELRRKRRKKEVAREPVVPVG